MYTVKCVDKDIPIEDKSSIALLMGIVWEHVYKVSEDSFSVLLTYAELYELYEPASLKLTYLGGIQDGQ